MPTQKRAPPPPSAKPAPRRVTRASPAPQQWEVVPPPPAPPTPAAPAAKIDQNQWAMFAHLAAFASFIVPFGNIIGPLVVWQIKKENPYVAQHGKESLNFQISLWLYALVLTVVFVLIFLSDFMAGVETMQPGRLPAVFFAMGPLVVITIALAIFNIVAVIVASLRANNGRAFRYPLSIRFVR